MRLAGDIANLTSEQRAVLELKPRQRRAPDASERDTISPRADQTAPDISFGQQRLWFVEQLQPSGSANHISAAVRIQGPLSRAALVASLIEIVRRHEVLRTVYVDHQGRAIPRVIPDVRLEIPMAGVADGAPEARMAEARRLAATEAARPFDLAIPPMLRALLIRLSDDDHVLVLVAHHIAVDGWSMGILIRELSVLYSAALETRASDLPELSLQYADFAAWQRQYASGPRLTNQIQWWRAQLQGLTPLDVPADHLRPPIASASGGRESIVISHETVAGLSAVSRQHGATSFMVLLAALQLLLSRWTGQTDVAIGSPVAGRNRREVENMVGLFVNMLVFRSMLHGDPSFSDLVAQVRATVTAALEHQDVPFEKLIDELQIDRSLSQSPLTPVVFSYQNIPTSDVEFNGTHVTAFEFERATSRFDLCVLMLETSEGLRTAIEYRTDLFERATIRRLLRAYQRVIESVVRDPQQRIGSVPLLDEDDRHEIITRWNATDRPLPSDATIHGLVAAQAALRPDAEAVVCGSDRLTYRELDRRSNRLAHVLRQRHVGVDSRVGISLEKSSDLIVALLGILKAGGAYVPLDPSYPPQRIASMIASAGVELVVTQEQLVSCLPASTPVLCLDAERGAIDAQPVGAVKSDVGPDGLAYISYTSGSTGHPKGVEVCHRAVVRLLCGVDYVRLGADQTFLQLAPLSFDASTFEIWGALVHGGRLVVYPDRVPDFDELGRALSGESVTTLWLTSSLYNAVIDRSPEILKGVRQLLIGGEALSVEHVRRGRFALPDTRIINGYGPTEGTTFTCCHAISDQELEADTTSVPIGKPISNTQAFVLDRNAEPVPVGVPGELFVGGDGLARGYSREPRLTAERFVPDGLSGKPGSRLYRTGDLVRYHENGTIAFLGRRDAQVKVRGYRIELGEIETALMRHPAVTAAVASVVSASDGTKTLLAYVVPAVGQRCVGSEVRDSLKALLPDYMLPAAVVLLDLLPLTANGKLDRAALPIPQIASSNERVEPRNEVDEIIAETCRELLNGVRISMDDNFFALGGHSLLATQLVSRLKRALQTDVKIRQVFEARTLAELGDSILDSLVDSAPTDAA